nr:PREDICTED: thyrotropin-releasing hormone-degrading ectoenzyme-like [Linepithema humile]
MLQVGISMAFSHIILNRLIIIIIILLPTAKFTKNDTELNYNVLNGNFKPLHYGVKIEYDVYRNVFLGECNITIQINRPTENITINTNTISIKQINLFDDNDNEMFSIQMFSFGINEFKEMYIYLDFIQLSGDVLYPDTYILKFIYSGMILDDEKDADKEKDKMLNKKGIKVIKAVELFPCWNKAIFKTTFNISIKHHKDYKFLSSMPIRIQVENLDNTLWTHFDTSPLMSAKHLTIVKSTFTNYFAYIRNVKFWYRKEMIDQMRFAENIVRVVIYYLKLKSKAIIPKIDYFVIENFQHSNEKTRGFILLREEDIIYNYTLHSVRKMEVANLMARETISYWYDDVPLWSKEGFITFLAAHILKTQSYSMMDLFYVQEQQESLRFDTLPTDSLPSRTSLHYIKSSIIWRMLYHIISDMKFWTSLNMYKNIQYNQTNATDTKNLSTIVSFWNAVESVLGSTSNIRNFNKDVIDIWSMQGHYPVLYVTRNYSTNLVSITYINSKHILFPNMKQYELYVVYTTKSLMNIETHHFWLSTLTPYHYISRNIHINDWIILNLQQTGYYRINYDLENWKRLAWYLYNENYNTIPVLNRAQIIDDAFYFLTQKQLNINLFWDITSFLLKDTDYVAWYPMIKAVEYMTCVWEVQHNALIKEVIKEMFNKLLQNIGYDDKFDESDFTKCLREEAVKWACVLGEPECRKIATSKLKEDLQTSEQNKLSKWREWIYCKGLMTANPLTWDKVLIKWERTSDDAFLDYLTCFTNPDTYRIYLDIIINERVHYNVKNSKTSAKNVLLIVAKHARNDDVLKYIFDNIRLFEFSINKQIDHIAILIVIITHEHSVEQFEKITEFAKGLCEKRLIDAVKQKIKKRKLECEKRVTYYERIDIPTYIERKN